MTPEEGLERRVAEMLRADYDTEFDAAHLSWQDFAGVAHRAVLICRESIARDIEAKIEDIGPSAVTDHALRVAARIARGVS